MTFGVEHAFQNDFYKVHYPHYFALISRSVSHADDYLERIIEEGNERSGRDGWQVDSFWVKKMDEGERRQFPPVRLRNALIVTNKPSIIPFPRPVGIVYTGTGADALAGESQAYFIAPYISGKPLNRCFGELVDEIKDNFFHRLGISLSRHRERGIFPLDFAPRDIVYEKREDSEIGVVHLYTLVDTEHVAVTSEGANSKIRQKLKAEQRGEFRREYKGFLSKTEMAEAVRIVFDDRDKIILEGGE